MRRLKINRSFYLGGLLLLLGGWLAWLGDKTPETGPQASLPSAYGEPETYIEGGELKRYNAQGRLFQTLITASITHYPDSELAEFTRPLIYHRTTDGQQWRLQAKRGELRKGETLFLDQEVHLTPIEPESAYTPAFTTRRLWLNTQAEIASTPDQVRLSGPGGYTLGKGMLAQLAEGRVQFLEEVRSLYQVQPARSGNAQEDQR